MKRAESVTTYPEGLVGIPAAARWLNVPEGWLRKKVSSREVPFTFVGKHARFSADHLAQIVAEGEQQVWNYSAPARTRLRAVS